MLYFIWSNNYINEISFCSTGKLGGHIAGRSGKKLQKILKRNHAKEFEAETRKVKLELQQMANSSKKIDYKV